MPRIRRKKNSGEDIVVQEAAAAHSAAASVTLALPAGTVVQAREAFAVGDRIVARGETFHAGHPLVKANPAAFDEFQVDNRYEER